MKIVIIAIAAIVAIVLIGLIVLGSIDLQAPSGQVEKTIPADSLPH